MHDGRSEVGSDTDVFESSQRLSASVLDFSAKRLLRECGRRILSSLAMNRLYSHVYNLHLTHFDVAFCCLPRPGMSVPIARDIFMMAWGPMDFKRNPKAMEVLRPCYQLANQRVQLKPLLGITLGYLHRSQPT